MALPTNVAPFEIKFFASFEHNHIGKFIRQEIKELSLPNGVVIEFENIIALAGDFYGQPKHPIINPLIVEEEDTGRDQRFIEAFNTLARAPRDKLQRELDKLLEFLKKESEQGQSFASKIWDKITGGIWVGSFPVKQGRMLQLARNNHDHFDPYAKHSYLTGHQQAIDKAREAGNCPGDEEKRLLHEALAMDAFACHFLTDGFASGHIR